ncbi:N-acyl amino acid synthase FeeM domain-containing protein [Bdellovibrio sp. HCB2-146]|uniref:N-acyl amino acid synthase FeeM domain-containing protein n=1 Tax=Bdellovibrio sp. HCB2-146 TaxID=3394362 RepID=UPI0039BC5E2A
MSGKSWLKQSRRYLRSTAFNLLPSFLAHRVIRNTLNLNVPSKNSTLTFEVVSTLEDLRAALALLQNNFEKEGYADKTASGVRLTPYHLLPETVVIVAKEFGRVIATISVIPRTSFGVPLDSSFELGGFITGKEKIVEVSALAVDSASAGQRGEVLYNLMKFMYHCNVDVLGAEVEVIGVNPKMVPLYEAILLFNRIPGTSKSEYDFVRGAPVIPMTFDLRTATEEFAKVYGNKPAHLNLLDFFRIPPPPHFRIPEKSALKTLLPQLRAKDLKTILSWEPAFFGQLSQVQKENLERLYSIYPECLSVLKESAAYAK